jgi:hypothetical protein
LKRLKNFTLSILIPFGGESNQANEKVIGGEQPIDVDYTIIALVKFFKTFRCDRYQHDMETAFSVDSKFS